LRGVVTQLYKHSLRFARVVFLLNPDDMALFVNGGMVDRSKVRLLNGIGLKLDHYQLAPPVQQPLVFILIGRLLREKGLYDYLEAARRVKASHPDVRFLVLGGVDMNPSSISEAEVRTWVDEGTIEWPGQVSDVRGWIAESSVFVLPSYREGLPRSTQEVMAMGRPVITTDVPGCRETVVEGLNGYLVPVRDSNALAQAMLRFVREPELIAVMGRESRRMAEERFDVNQINAQILNEMEL
jgi:glycosyltransferase involved in cell wall biosynthesis